MASEKMTSPPTEYGPAADAAGRPRFNVASSDVRLPAVRDYEQAEAEIRDTLHPTVAWFRCLAVAVALMLVGAATWTYQIYEGLGAAGYHPPVMWGVYVITLVFWIGIGHAGTLISAILYPLRSEERRVGKECRCRWSPYH